MLQFIKYSIVGLISNGVAFAAYLILVKFGFDHKLAMSVVYLLATLQSFLLNKNWTFNNKNKSQYVFLKYFALYLSGYFINLIILIVAVDFFNYSHKWIQGSSIIIIALLLYAGQKYWVFKNFKNE